MKPQINVLSITEKPQRAIYLAMHQDYSPGYVWEDVLRGSVPDEVQCGRIVVDRLLKGDRGHYGCLEHPQIVLACGGFDHNTMVQLRTHRLMSFDVQSFRYTSQQFIEVAEEKRDVETVFYIRPPGYYTNRGGKKYEWTTEDVANERVWCLKACLNYKQKIDRGISEEHARHGIPTCVRQHFVLSCNMRQLMHLLDLRWKADAQLEAQTFSQLLYDIFLDWSPAIAEWYMGNRAKKARLAP